MVRPAKSCDLREASNERQFPFDLELDQDPRTFGNSNFGLVEGMVFVGVPSPTDFPSLEPGRFGEIDSVSEDAIVIFISIIRYKLEVRKYIVCKFVEILV